MSTPKFEYRSRDAADFGPMPKAFMKALLDTDRFRRTTKSQILFNVNPGKGAPDYVMITRKDDLRTILEEGDVLRIVGDVGDEAFDSFWFWINARKWQIAPAAHANLPKQVEANAPVRR